VVGVVSAAACAVLFAAVPLGDAYPGVNGMIAYTHEPPGEPASVNTINPDGSGDATFEAGATSRVWSPDGNKLLFNRFPGAGAADIWFPRVVGQLVAGRHADRLQALRL
jgi:hypothetical protein